MHRSASHLGLTSLSGYSISSTSPSPCSSPPRVYKYITEVVVVRIRSKKWGESPIAIISINNENKQNIIIEELKNSCRKYLASYKQPVKILVINEKDIPRSTTGKVQRHLVEKMLKTVFNIEIVD